MHWLTSPRTRAPSLPAIWLIDAGAAPKTLPERSALRRGTARQVLAGQLGIVPEAATIAHDGAGRPLLPGTGLHLSLATRAGVVAMGLADRPVGVDLEEVRAQSSEAEALLHPEERALLAGLRGDMRRLAFARLWAAKEAFVKALGTGFATPPESFRVRLAAPGDGFSVHAPQRTAPVIGHDRITKNGGQEMLAAAIVLLG
jgi:phosphopantetheinyl transferase